MAKILLVEDNPLNRDMLTRRLQRKGYEVVAATTGQEALDQAAQGPFDLVLMDLRLPDISGQDVARRLKANAATRLTPVIALTAHAMEGDRELALGAGCDDYDTKPVDLPRLLEKMESLLSRSRR